MNPQPIGPRTVETAWASRLANLVHAIRHDWDEPGIRSAILKVADRPLLEVAVAALAATGRVDQRTPAVIAFDGEHWRALDRLTGDTQPEARRPQPPDRLACPVHGDPEPCRTCPPPVTPDVAKRRLAEARAAIRAAREDRDAW